MHIVHHNILECALCFVSTAPHAESSYSYSYSYDYLSHSDYQFLATIIVVVVIPLLVHLSQLS